jgi:hypothetical protein
MKLDRWLELEDTMITNQPLIYFRGKRIPDPRIEPTEYYLFCYICRRTSRGVQRRTLIEMLKATSKAELDEKLLEFAERKDVILIRDQKRPDYLSYHGEPLELLEMPESA